MSVGEGADKSVGNHDNPASGHHQASSHWKATSRDKEVPNLEESTNLQKDGRDGAQERVGTRMIDRSREILDNKAALK